MFNYAVTLKGEVKYLSQLGLNPIKYEIMAD